MRRMVVALFVLVSLTAQPARSETRQFPYEAIVEAREANVYSGPGRKYYVTGTLKSGERVVVHRHDVGGWYMIAPPAGSFSYVDARYVRREGNTTGVLTESNVVAWVGSSDGRSRSVWQVRLSTGQSVDILGETTLDGSGGAVQMLKIAPPRGEFRWVRGEDVVPIDRLARRRNDREPDGFAQDGRRGNASSVYEDRPPGARPSGGRQGETQDQAGEPFGSRPLIRTQHGRAVRRAGPTAEELEVDRRRLAALDERFRRIVRRETPEWRFEGLESDYRRFREEACSAALRSQVDLRLDAVERYRTIKAEYEQIIKLTAQTTDRERQLAALQQQQALRLAATTDPAAGASSAFIPDAGPLASAATGVAPQPEVLPPAPRAATAPQMATLPRAGTAPQAGPMLVPHRDADEPTPANTPEDDAASSSSVTIIDPQPEPAGSPVYGAPSAMPEAASPPAVRRPSEAVESALEGRPAAGPVSGVPRSAPPAAAELDGAGIIQRAVSPAPGAPGHVLLAPGGRIVAWLQSDGRVDLDRYLGRQMGIYGHRTHRRDLDADLIVVSGLEPVRLIK